MKIRNHCFYRLLHASITIGFLHPAFSTCRVHTGKRDCMGSFERDIDSNDNDIKLEKSDNDI